TGADWRPSKRGYPKIGSLQIAYNDRVLISFWNYKIFCINEKYEIQSEVPPKKARDKTKVSFVFFYFIHLLSEKDCKKRIK
ncbi:hypothetical protein, partial [Phocaeicola coprocola]|uniref:hypothetical protein n=1 Tax=Phocaeicola coprocola TaxID=310298 RepID=UPI001C70426C